MQTFRIIGMYIPHNGKSALPMEYMVQSHSMESAKMEMQSYGSVPFFAIYNNMGEVLFNSNFSK